jgi:hypothetical protein
MQALKAAIDAGKPSRSNRAQMAPTAMAKSSLPGAVQMKIRLQTHEPGS